MAKLRLTLIMPRKLPALSLSPDQEQQIRQGLTAHGTPQQVALRKPDYSGGGPRAVGDHDRPSIGNSSQDGALVAWAFRPARSGELVGSRPRAQADLWAGTGQSPGGGDAAKQTQGDDPLELPAAGEEPGSEQVHGEQPLAEP